MTIRTIKIKRNSMPTLLTVTISDASLSKLPLGGEARKMPAKKQREKMNQHQNKIVCSFTLKMIRTRIRRPMDRFAAVV